MPVPVELRTLRLLLRPWRAEDAAALQPVLEMNWSHLGPWVPARVVQPAPIPELEERLAGFAAEFSSTRAWRFGLFTLYERRVLGEVALFPRAASGRVPLADADRVELGYWLRSDETGRGFVTEAARAVLAVAGGMPQFSHAEIRCDERNAPSAAVPRRLGFVLETTIRQSDVASPEVFVQLQVWTSALSRFRTVVAE